MLRGGYKRGSFVHSVAQDVTLFALFDIISVHTSYPNTLNLGTRQNLSTGQPLRPSFARNSKMVG